MDPRLEEYKERYDDYQKLAETVNSLITERLKQTDISPMQVKYRVKTQESIAGKLFRKSDRYPDLLHMTDIVGFRIICYFSDQVDTVATFLEEMFDVDTENSIDKRSSIPATAFGYLSLHYICRLRKENAGSEDLCRIPFEIQIRSVLQHTWAEIEHDLGYKSEFGVPRNIRREFSRVAGLLEVADELFLNIKNDLRVYKAEVREKIANDCAGDMSLDLITLSEYIEQSRTMKSLLEEISSITGAEIMESDIESFLPQLMYFNIETLDDLSRFVHEEREGALLLAKDSLEGVELDEIASTAGIYYLIRSKLTFGNYSESEITDFYRISIKSKKRFLSRTAGILKKREKFKDKL